MSSSVPLCGCDACKLDWKTGGAGLKALIEGMSCPVLAATSTSWTPPVKITEGETCTSFLSDLMKTDIDGMKVSDFLNGDSTCAANLKISGTKQGLEEMVDDASNSSGYILPFHLAFNRSAASCMGAPSMGYAPDIPIFNEGKMDGWNSARQPGFGMSYFERSDLPFYYSLADAFTFGDHYHQSTFTATCPNREFLFSGSNGLSIPDSGKCMLDDSEPDLTWETMGETLENAGVSWKVYQQEDNFDDNGFAWFANYKNAKPGDVLYDKGMSRGPDFVSAFAADVANDTLPQVSWLVGPASLSEHASNHPADGEDLTARLMKIMGAAENSHVFEKTVFLLNYDEGGQFFDHMWTPVPPKPQQGKSTVTTVGELTLEEAFTIPAGNPIGLGFRVPFMAISPWSRGGYVYSEVSDHASVIKFLEKKFDVRCPNLSPWRRAVVSDLTAAFDFSKPDFSAWPIFPDTSANVNTSKKECDTLPPPTLPAGHQHMPPQEPGVRASRALPYLFQMRMEPIMAAQNATDLTFTIDNPGTVGVVIIMYDRVSPSSIPMKYTVEAGKSILDVITVPQGRTYGYSAHGPNGWVNQWGGVAQHWAPASNASNASNASITPHLSLRLHPEADAGMVTLLVERSAVNGSVAPPSFNITDNAYGSGSNITALGPSAPILSKLDVSKSGNWYDISVSHVGGASVWRFMGRMETGSDATSDPASSSGHATLTLPAAGFPVGLEGNPSIYADGSHASVPEWYRTHKALKLDVAAACKSGRGQQIVKDACFNSEPKMEL